MFCVSNGTLVDQSSVLPSKVNPSEGVESLFGNRGARPLGWIRSTCGPFLGTSFFGVSVTTVESKQTVPGVLK